MPEMSRIWFCLLIATLGCSAQAQLAPRPVSTQFRPGMVQAGLVPAQFQAKKDKLGFSWDVTSNGRIQYGTNRLFNGCGYLQVNGSGFSPTSSGARQMTRDGSEYFLTQTISNVTVTRRIKVDVESSSVRYVEIFENQSASAITLSVTLGTSMRSAAQAVLTDKGRNLPATTPAGTPVIATGETGIIAYRARNTPTPYGQQPSALFYLAGQGSQVRPGRQNSGNQQSFVFLYQFSVPPKKKVALLHGVAQRYFTSPPNKQMLTKHFQTFRSSRWTADLPADLRNAIVNVRVLAGFDQAELNILQPTIELADAWAIERGASDYLVFDQQAHIAGTCVGKNVIVDTQFGEAVVPIDQIAAIVGGNGEGRPTRVHLRNGEILVGAVQFEAIQFNSDAALQFELQPEQLNVLFTKVDAKSDTAEKEQRDALLRTRRGDRVALSTLDDLRLPLVTAFGPLTLPLKDVRSAVVTNLPQPMYQFVLKDGSRLSAMLQAGVLSLETRRFGTQPLAMSMIAEFAQFDEVATLPEDEQLPRFKLTGDNVLVGGIDVPEVGVSTAAGKTPVPTSEIRSMTRVDESERVWPAFAFEMADGSEFEGRLNLSLIPIRSLDKQWLVPVSYLNSFVQPDPRPALARRLAAEYQELADKAVAEKLKQLAVEDGLEVVHLTLLSMNNEKANAVVEAISKLDPALGKKLAAALQEHQQQQEEDGVTEQQAEESSEKTSK